jgi:hypothetical protein
VLEGVAVDELVDVRVGVELGLLVKVKV